MIFYISLANFTGAIGRSFLFCVQYLFLGHAQKKSITMERDSAPFLVPTNHREAALQELKAAAKRFAAHCGTFRGAIVSSALIQLATSALLFVANIVGMVMVAKYSYWLALPLAIPAGGLLVRLFIIQHDCGHGSFLPSRMMNDYLGRAISVLTVTPYSMWRREHALHHACSANLGKRGIGDIETLTVKEYQALSAFGRFRYRVMRNPLFLFLFGVPFYFLFVHRIPWFHGLKAKEVWKSVLGLDLAIILVYGGLSYFVGTALVLKVIIPTVMVTSVIGGWLFYIQHQFEDTRWFSSEEWDFQTAAVYGSSYYVLPKPLQWFTGNIGIHHVHHLNSLIPNYRLQSCLDTMPELKNVNRLYFWQSLKCVGYKLWDEEGNRLVGFRALRRPKN